MLINRLINSIFIIVIILILLLILMAIYHHVMLTIEAKKLNSVGTLVKVNDKNINIYIAGDKQENTIVLLSGSGVQAPIYDYKVLYSKLTDLCRLVVVEKFGYGYSDITKTKRDVRTMVEENRTALRKVGVDKPYILMPHSMSALEAIYWATTYPEEVKGIIGLDMAVPLTYDENKNNLSSLKFNKIMTFFGFHRISKFCPISERELTDQEINQNKYLVYRNSLNKNVFEECKLVYSNAKTVEKMGTPNIPILMFASKLTSSETSKRWRSAQEKFAAESNKCELIILECGHNLHYYEADYMALKIREFIYEVGGIK